MKKMLKRKTKTLEDYYCNDPLMQLLKPLLVENGTWENILKRDFKLRTEEKQRSKYYKKSKL